MDKATLVAACITGPLWVLMFEEIGNGVMDAWLSMERNGELDNLSKKEKADRLIKLLSWFQGDQDVEPIAPAPVHTPKKMKFGGMGAPSSQQ